jgi:hypothetical protein
MWRRRSLLGLGVLLGMGVSCSSDPPPPTTDGGLDGAMDGAADAGQPDVLTACPTAPPAFERGDATGASNPLMVPAGAARAGRLSAEQLPVDRTGLANWAAGDYVLANERVALLVEAARPSSGYDPWGGRPVGIARVQDGRLVDAGDFGEAIFGLGRFIMATETVTVLRDGTMGGDAVVRAEGPMRPVPFIDDFARALAPQDFNGLRAAIDYTLRPGADHVDIALTVSNPAPEARSVRTVLHAFFQGYRMMRFFPDAGFSRTGRDNAINTATLGWIDDGGTSWAWQVPSETLTPFISVSGFDAFAAPRIELAACANSTTAMARLVIGGRGPGLDGLQQSLAALGGRTLRAVRVTVRDAADAPARGARVHVVSADGMRYLTRATVDDMGVATLHVPAGEAVRAMAWRQGDPPGALTDLPATMDALTVRLGATGTVALTVRDGATMQGMPVRVQITPETGDAPTVPGNYGENVPGAGRVHTLFPQDGAATVSVPPGRWRVVVARGFEYTLFNEVVTVTAGQRTEVNATLRRVVDTTGNLCGDFHIHTHRSPDSGDSARLKLASGAADGVEVMARSEHEVVSDFQPLVEEMGLTPWVRGLTSLELTTFVWGHFGVFPLTPRPSEPNGGNFDLGRSHARAGVWRRARAPRRPGAHHQPPARRRGRRVLRRRGLQRHDRRGAQPAALGRPLHRGGILQRHLLRGERHQRPYSRLVFLPLPRAPGVLRGLVGQPRHQPQLPRRLPPHVHGPRHRRPAYGHARLRRDRRPHGPQHHLRRGVPHRRGRGHGHHRRPGADAHGRRRRGPPARHRPGAALGDRQHA